jgi:hypothetical protein
MIEEQVSLLEGCVKWSAGGGTPSPRLDSQSRPRVDGKVCDSCFLVDCTTTILHIKNHSATNFSRTSGQICSLIRCCYENGTMLPAGFSDP